MIKKLRTVYRNFLWLLLSVWFLFAAKVPALADITNPVIGDLGTNDTKEAETGATFGRYFIILWRALITIGGLAVVIYFVWGAIEWIVAGGDSSKVQKARDRITQAIIGMIILAASFTIVEFISDTFFAGQFSLLQLTLQ